MTCAGCNRIESHPMTLHTGIVVCNQCPAWRAECEARYVLAQPGKVARAALLDGVEAKRGKAAADELRELVRALWAADRAAAVV